MQKKYRFLFPLCIGLFLVNTTSFARILPPQGAPPSKPPSGVKPSVVMEPPVLNPHPPQSKEDKASVAFAEKAINLLLKQPLSKTLEIKGIEKTVPILDKSLHCLEEPSCYSKDILFTNELIQIHQTYGELDQFDNIHVVPASSLAKPETAAPGLVTTMRNLPKVKADEYIIHAYTHFNKNPDLWVNVYLIVTKDRDQQILLRSIVAQRYIPMLPC